MINKITLNGYLKVSGFKPIDICINWLVGYWLFSFKSIMSMSSPLFNIQKKTPFSKSLVWQLNRDFYHQNGIAAWSDDLVPHQISNSSLAATSYAELIYAFLKDLESDIKPEKLVYILELGAGHGRLCYNILEHLEQLILDSDGCSTKYCYVLTDIVEDNLAFYSSHPKLQKYYKRGLLDISFFDAKGNQELLLRKSKIKIAYSDLEQPILSIANYFFDSLPNELYYFKDGNIFNCSVSIDSSTDPFGKSAQELINEMELTYHISTVKEANFKNEVFNTILSEYNKVCNDTYILFPKLAMECLSNISSFSKMGLILLTMDKGYKEIQELSARKKPDFVKHGSFSLWVNFHAMSQFCILNGGLSMFDSSTNFSIDLGCLSLIKQDFNYQLFKQAYRKHSSQLNLDDFNSIKKIVYRNLPNVDLSELLGLIKLNSYDSSIFINLLPSIKQLSKDISIRQRKRLRQTINQVWNKYYSITEDYDLSYELGGLMYDIGYYDEALGYYRNSSESFGDKIDVDFNQILCYYQMREDELFYKALKAAKLRFPETDVFIKLENLDMT